MKKTPMLLACVWLSALAVVVGCGGGGGESSGEVAAVENGGNVRVYRLKSVFVPPNSSHTQTEYYKDGPSPKLRVYIDRNGECIATVNAKSAAWEIDFPQSKENRIAVYEGSDDSYLIRLRDWNTYFQEVGIMQIPELTAEDFADGEIVEKLGKLDDRSRAVRFVFEAVDE